MNDERNIAVCKRCCYANYRDERVIFCGVCMRRILDEMQQMKAAKAAEKTEDNRDEQK